MTWRAEAIGRLQREHFDLLVVGGGITGAGIALEATLRGYKVALVEASDFASGTSRRSTKLVHGGLRYLIQGATEFVREALAERTFLLEHAPGLVKPLPFLAPLQVLHEPLERVDGLLALYERLGDPRPLPGSRHVAADELAQRCAIFEATDGAVEYHEADTDDAQLTLAVLRAALERGAVAASRLRVVGLEAVASTVCATLRDELDGETVQVQPRNVVLAVGAWLGALGQELGIETPELCPAKGTHVVLEQPRRPLTCGVLLRHPSDARLLTLTPWHDALLLGSTDVECDPAELNCPKPTVEEVEYLLAALAAAAPNWTPRVLAAWSGIRPLLGHSGDRTADLSREDRLLDAAPGVVAIAGGKLTTFRRLAQRTLDRVDELSGHSGPAEPFPHLQPLPTGLHELARDGLVSTLDDVMTQRLPLSLLHPDAAAGRAPGIASEIAPIMRWSTEACEQQVASYRAGLDRFRDPRRA